MSFILRFQTRIGPFRTFSEPNSCRHNEVLSSGTKTVTEVRQESADNDPAIRGFQTFPKEMPR